MTTSPAQHPSYSDTQLFPVGYRSTILELFVESLARWSDVRILDAGPVCQENITFFARKIQRHYACDLFSRLHRELGEQARPGKLFWDLD